MTPEQYSTLAFVARYIKLRKGISPTYEEIAAGIGLASKTSVHRLLSGLKDQGYVDWVPMKPRCLRIVRMPETHEVPASKEDLLLAEVEALKARVAALEGHSDKKVIPLRGSVR